jgi:DNA-damage-inducible protein D
LIEKRMRGIAIREELTDEWKNRNVKEEHEYAILTAEIAQAAFGVTPIEHKQLKGLKRENLRDHMTNIELIFSMLGEVAGVARKDLEKKTGKRVVSPENYLTEPESRKRLK